MKTLGIFFYPQSTRNANKQLKGGNQMTEQNKKPQTTHGSEQNEAKSVKGLKISLNVLRH